MFLLCSTLGNHPVRYGSPLLIGSLSPSGISPNPWLTTRSLVEVRREQPFRTPLKCQIYYNISCIFVLF